jgi:hypothetical protein
MKCSLLIIFHHTILFVMYRLIDGVAKKILQALSVAQPDLRHGLFFLLKTLCEESIFRDKFFMLESVFLYPKDYCVAVFDHFIQREETSFNHVCADSDSSQSHAQMYS